MSPTVSLTLIPFELVHVLLHEQIPMPIPALLSLLHEDYGFEAEREGLPVWSSCPLV
jgi:hypothetical protein